MNKPRFAGLSAKIAGNAAPEPVSVPESDSDGASRGSSRTKGRMGKKLVAGHFSDELSRRLRVMAAAEGTTVQALMGEALDMLFADRGINRFGER